MARKKLIRFADNLLRDNILEPGKTLYTSIKGKWQQYFGNANPLVVELGCGKGEYTSGLAQRFPDCNFIGIDVKGERIWVGSSIALEKKLSNVAFIRSEIQFLEQFFQPGEISQVWIPFPDPQAKDRREKHRLTNARFLGLYRRLMVPEGLVHFKTDNRPLFEYTLGILGVEGFPKVSDLPDIAPPYQQLKYTFDLYQSPLLSEHHGIITRFEERYLQRGRPIHYLRFRFCAENLIAAPEPSL
jgi:tRNA (guanine-N7-)-methyltransferase